MFHADGRTDRHDEVNSRFLQFCERAYNLRNLIGAITLVGFLVGRKTNSLLERTLIHRLTTGYFTNIHLLV
jgi:hypothetical protein